MTLCVHEYDPPVPVSCEWTGDSCRVVCTARCRLCGTVSALQWTSDPLSWEWSSPSGEEPCLFPRFDPPSPVRFVPVPPKDVRRSLRNPSETPSTTFSLR